MAYSPEDIENLYRKAREKCKVKRCKCGGKLKFNESKPIVSRDLLCVGYIVCKKCGYVEEITDELLYPDVKEANVISMKELDAAMDILYHVFETNYCPKCGSKVKKISVSISLSANVLAEVFLGYKCKCGSYMVIPRNIFNDPLIRRNYFKYGIPCIAARIKCPYCGLKIYLGTSYLKDLGKCPECGERFKLGLGYL